MPEFTQKVDEVDIFKLRTFFLSGKPPGVQSDGLGVSAKHLRGPGCA